MRRIIIICVVLMLAACTPPQRKSDAVHIVCTTSIVADGIRNLVPTDVVVTALMGPGVDPHLYKATQGDLQRLQDADLVFYNGLHLEGKMGDVLQKLGRIKPVFAVASNLDQNVLIQLQQSNDSHDPHIWFDLELWSQALSSARDYLIEQKPEWSDHLATSYETYKSELLQSHESAKAQIGQLPLESRVLVTAHDAFSYFGRAYGMEVLGLQGISTASEYGLNDVSMLVRTISDRKIPAVFVESSVPKRSIEAVIEGCQKNGHQVKLGGQLYSDALGDAGSNAETLIGAFEANVRTISEGLKPVNHE